MDCVCMHVYNISDMGETYLKLCLVHFSFYDQLLKISGPKQSGPNFHSDMICQLFLLSLCVLKLGMLKCHTFLFVTDFLADLFRAQFPM